MLKKLVIVESPAKARTLSRILGNQYDIKASVGHVRDLPKWGLGVDINDSFTPNYVIPKEKRKVVEQLKEASKRTSAVYLATDPDREGEAISWHLTEAAEFKKLPIHRIVFHEITEDAINQAFLHPRSLDMNLVDAQQTRRILDRLVGYKISPLLCKNVKSKLSAGRVQSAALKLVVDREQEVLAFVPQEYWTVEAELSKQDKKGNGSFIAKFIGHSADSHPLDIHTEQEAKDITNKLNVANYAVSDVRKKKVTRQPAPPFITSTLQQEAWRKLHFSAPRTMALAQQLYEGLPIAEEGAMGLITYMRTDSTVVAKTALQETREFITGKFGTEFLPPQVRKFTKKVKGAQEAHEAIRPTRADREPASIKQFLTHDQGLIYELIWKRMVASQMAAASFQTTTVDIEAKEKESYLLRATGSVMEFPGFLSLYSETKDESDTSDEEQIRLPRLVQGEELSLLDISPSQHFTQPPPRYNEASLIKSMEERGIGRPSTYAPIISTLYQREYVHRKGGKICPLELGFTVSQILTEHFSDIVDIGFTAQMEEKLDDIAQGKRGWAAVLRTFYDPFEETLHKASVNMVSLKEPPQPTDETCPKCGKPMVVRTGRYGKFVACTGFPKCKTTKTLADEEDGERPSPSPSNLTDEICPECGKSMLIKKGRFGEFLACSGYPDCTTTKRLPGQKKTTYRKKGAANKTKKSRV